MTELGYNAGRRSVILGKTAENEGNLNRMRLKCLACEALARIVYLCAARSPHVVDVELFKLGWHRDPDDLRARVQRSIDAAVGEGYDALILAYGLCGRATAGLVARDVPLVIPRAHDCITLFLGSRQRYQQQFTDKPGTYWYVRDYVERMDAQGTTLSLGADMGADADALYDEYVAKYGRDNADYLMEVMGAWREHYNRAAYIDMGFAESPEVESQTREEAQRRGWTFDRLAGDLVLIRRLLDGDWAEDFLVLPPGAEIQMSYDAQVVDCVMRGPAS